MIPFIDLQAQRRRIADRVDRVVRDVIESGRYLNVRSLWHDGKRKRLENCLSDFIAGLHLTADAIKRRLATGVGKFESMFFGKPRFEDHLVIF